MQDLLWLEICCEDYGYNVCRGGIILQSSRPISLRDFNGDEIGFRSNLLRILVCCDVLVYFTDPDKLPALHTFYGV